MIVLNTLQRAFYLICNCRLGTDHSDPLSAREISIYYFLFIADTSGGGPGPSSGSGESIF